jgi:hypothetical protein
MPHDIADDRNWPTTLDDFEHSGLTHAEFCRQRRLPLHTFRKQLYLHRAARRRDQPGAEGLTNGRSAPLPSPPFLPVSILPADKNQARRGSAPASSPVELFLPGGRRIAVGPGFDSGTLLQLIELLEGWPYSA